MIYGYFRDLAPPSYHALRRQPRPGLAIDCNLPRVGTQTLTFQEQSGAREPPADVRAG